MMQSSHWQQLLREYGCASDEQLIAAGIPINNNIHFLNAYNEADENIRVYYRKISSLTLFQTHCQFIRCALSNDKIGMENWAKRYRENCVTNDEFAKVHETIVNVGGLKVDAEKTVLATGTLLSIYSDLKIPFEREPAASIKTCYVDAMGRMFDALKSGQSPKYPEVVEKKTVPAVQEEPEPPKNSDTQSRNLPYAYYVSQDHYRLQQKIMAQNIENYCSGTFVTKTCVNHDFSEKYIELLVCPSEEFRFPIGIDGFGDTPAQRYFFVAQALEQSQYRKHKIIFRLYEKACMLDRNATHYQSAKQNCLQTYLLPFEISEVQSYCDKLQDMCDRYKSSNLIDITKFRNACGEYTAKIRTRIADEEKFLSELLDIVAEYNDKDSVYLIHQSRQKLPDLERECLNKLESVRVAFEQKVEEIKIKEAKEQEIRMEKIRMENEKARKKKRNKRFLVVSIIGAVCVTAAVIVGCLL